MKNKINLRISLGIIIALAIFVSGCIKEDFDKPPFNVPRFTMPDGAELISIAELKSMHTMSGALDTVTTEDNLYIKGVVIANDSSGNIYKTLIIQDHTSGIELKLNKTNLFNEYMLGQNVYVKLKDLVLGDYGQLIQLGTVFNNSIGQLPEASIKNHLFKDSLPGTPPEPRLINSFNELVPEYVSTLVKFENAQFAEAGMPYTDEGVANTNRTLNISGGSLIVRNSSYSNFATKIIPEGKGTVIGVLGVFNGTYQLTLRRDWDVYGFSAPVLNHVFTQNPLTTMGWTAKNITGSQEWNYDAVSLYMKMSGNMGQVNYENEDWFISPSLDFTNSAYPKLSFVHAAKFGSPAEELEVWISDNYNGENFESANWTKLTVPNFPSGDDWIFIDSGNIDLSDFGGKSNVYIGFKYTSTPESATTWEIKSVSIN